MTLPSHPLAARLIRFFGSVSLLFLLSGCRLHTVVEEPDPPVALPNSWSQPLASEEPYEARWWESFHDDGLTRTVQTALGANMDVHAAWARLDRAEASARAAGAGFWPQLELGGVASRSKNLIFSNLGDLETESNRFTLSAAAGYEIDLWGKIASMRDSATLEYRATAEDLRTVVTTIAASTAMGWIALSEAIAQRELLERQLETDLTYLELVELRYAQGATGSLDVYRQRSQAAAIRSKIPIADTRIAAARSRLEALVARSGGLEEAFPNGELPQPPSLPALGIPSEIVNARPDVRAMRLRVEAADHRVGAALADRFPSIRLSADIGYLSKTVAELFENWIYSLAASIAGPVIDGGRRSAETDAARATVRELLALYGKTVLEALVEIEDALNGEVGARKTLEALETQERLAEKTLAEARQMYLNGLSDYLPTLNALQLKQSLQREMISARARLAAQRIALHRAVGGGWLVLPARPEPLGTQTGQTEETQ